MQSASSNVYVNQWLTYSDVDIEIAEFFAYTSTYENDWNETPDNEYLTISSDLSTITVNKAATEEDGTRYNRTYLVDNVEGETIRVESNRPVYFGDSFDVESMEEKGVFVEIYENNLYVSFSGEDFTDIAGNAYVARITLNTAKIGDEIILYFTAGKTL